MVYCFDASSILICQKPDFSQGRKSGQHLLSSPMPPVFGARDRNLSLYRRSSIGSRCKIVGHCPFSSLVRQQYTKHFGWVLMAPDSNISLRWSLTSSTNGGGIHLKCSLNGSVICHLNGMFGRVGTTLALLDPMRIHHDTWQRAGRPCLPFGSPLVQTAEIQLIENLPRLCHDRQLRSLLSETHFISIWQNIRLMGPWH